MRVYVRWFSLAVALAGWLAALWLGVDHGHAAGVNTWFITALSVGICFTIVAGQWFLIPTKAEIQAEVQASQAVYGVGYKDGLSCGACPLRPTPTERTPLGIVR